MSRAVNELSTLEAFANVVKRVKLGPVTVQSLVDLNGIHSHTARRHLDVLHEVGLVDREPQSAAGKSARAPRGDVYRWVD
jgi:predicted ArsR family transcriptional regulator